MAVQLHELPAILDKEIDRALLLRTGKALFFLESKLRSAYTKEFTSSSGSRGGVGAISSAIKEAQDFLEATIGVSDQGKHIAFREFGVKPAAGAQYPKHSKAPPIKSIYGWLRLSRLAVPKGIQDLAASRKTDNPNKPWYSNDPLMLWAYYLAQKIKARGVKPLRIIEKTAKTHASKIQGILDGK